MTVAGLEAEGGRKTEAETFKSFLKSLSHHLGGFVVLLAFCTSFPCGPLAPASLAFALPCIFVNL